MFVVSVRYAVKNTYQMKEVGSLMLNLKTSVILLKSLASINI